jgi:hypothetical protein
MDLADLYVSVLPDMSRFSSHMSDRLRNIGKTSGDKVGRDLGVAVETTAAKTTKGAFLQNRTLMQSARVAGAKIGGFLATSLGKQIGGRVTERLGTVLADKLYDRASARLKRVNWKGALANPAIGAAAVGAGIWLARKLTSSANKQVTAGFKPDLKAGTQKGLSGLKGGIAGILATLVGGAVVGGAKGFADAASDFNEQVAKSETIFGKSYVAIQKWAKAAPAALGMSTQEATAGAAAFGNLFDQLDFGSKQSVKMSKGFVQMATDAASFNNANPAEVMDAFLSATRGEYDALQRYIPTASAARIEAEAFSMTGKKTAKELTAADKAAALYQVSIEDLGKAHGDFKRTGDSYANQQRTFAANWANLRVQIGQYFLPIFNRATKYMNEEGFPALTRIVSVLGGVGRSVTAIGRAAITSLGGDFATQVDGATTNLTEIADWVETHEADITGFFLKVMNGAIDLGRGIAGMVAGGIRGFGQLAEGLAVFIDGAIPGLQGVLDGMAAIVDMVPGQNEAAQKIRDASTALGTGGAAAAAGLRNARDRANEAATAFENKVYPAFDKAQRRLNDLGQTKVFEAHQRDATRAAQIALDAIGTAAGGSQVKMKTFTDIVNGHTKANKALRERLEEARRKMIDQRLAGEAAGESQKELTKRWDKGREAIYREGRQMGLSEKEARKLAERYGKIPTKAETAVRQPGMPSALRDTEALRKRINEIPALKKVTITFSAKTFTGSNGITYRVNTSSPSSVGRLAEGGRVRGPGTGTSDSIMGLDDHGLPTTRVSKGEWVINEKASDKWDALLKAINEDKIPAMAAGGRYGKIVIPTAQLPRSLREQPGEIQDMIRGYVKGIGNTLGKAMTADVGGGVTNVVNPGGLTTFRGGRFTRLGAANLKAAERIAGQTFRVMQGGWRSRTPWSGTSHAGDAVDTQAATTVIRALRAVGWASGDRTGLGNWASHAHSVPSPRTGKGGGSAPWQYQDYLRRGGARQGLASPWGLATGGTVMRDGWARVGERGPEIIRANKGDRVDPIPGKRPLIINLGDFEVFNGMIDEDQDFQASLDRWRRR